VFIVLAHLGVQSHVTGLLSRSRELETYRLNALGRLRTTFQPILWGIRNRLKGWSFRGTFHRNTTPSHTSSFKRVFCCSLIRNKWYVMVECSHFLGFGQGCGVGGKMSDSNFDLSKISDSDFLT